MGAFAILLLLPFLFLSSDGDGGGTDPEPLDEPDPTPDPEPEPGPTPTPEPEPTDDPVLVHTGLTVSEDLFGVNAHYTVSTDTGTPTENFRSGIDAFQIEDFRFPAGRAEESGEDGVDWLDITELSENGELRPELTDFLDNVDGEVTLVISTTNAPLDEYGEGLSEWAEIVLNEYGDQIQAFEIGNEYWGRMGETEYGQYANIAIEELAAGIQNANSGDPQIIMQMGSPIGQSEFGAAVDDRPFLTRLHASNHTIIDQLSEDAKTHLDGVLEHYYWRQSPIPFDDTSAEIRHMDKDLRVWESRFEQDLDFYITEWNLKSGNCACNGMPVLSIYVEMVENMVELGVDVAHIWPMAHNTTNDIGGAADDTIVDTDEDGRVIETLRGAIFDIMSETLPGKELIYVDVPGMPEDFTVAAYQGGGEHVFFVTNATMGQLDVNIDLSEIVPDLDRVETTQISYDPDSSDGLRYVPGQGMVPATSVEINGEEYFINEHDVRAQLTDTEYDTASFDASFLPFEMLVIRAFS
ncbi:hypothetical protein [Shimia sp.]|uniref:hypothetical protein n=1 Tax=Shimia sp. TaxID=1954381 RepID=UPI003B8E54B9